MRRDLGDMFDGAFIVLKRIEVIFAIAVVLGLVAVGIAVSMGASGLGVGVAAVSASVVAAVALVWITKPWHASGDSSLDPP